MRISYTVLVLISAGSLSYGQMAQELGSLVDTNKLSEVNILTERGPFNGTLRFDKLVGTTLYFGKKNEQILLENTSTNLTTNNTRQTFAKVPGINVWESDGSGTNVSIACRGLSPNRSWEFNTRQNGFDISADPFGYPEAYYAPAFESLERIEVLRGAGALQYGPQFGGMINYITKTGLKGKKLGVESNQTVGSYGLFNSYTGVGGEVGKFNYYGYFHHRNAQGWRQNSQYNTNSGSISLGYKVTDKIKVGAEYLKWDNLSQQAGGYTDSVFKINPRVSYRSRNWFNLVWQMTAFSTEYTGKNLKINWKTFGLLGDRKSVGNVGPIANAQGVIQIDNLTTLRTVDIDNYKNWGSEIRIAYTYNVLGLTHHLSGGVRYFNGTTKRVRGAGSADSKPDFLIMDRSNLTRDFQFNTFNTAIFAENAISVGNKLTITPGIRLENLENKVAGKKPITFNNKVNRQFILGGVTAQYNFLSNLNLYGNVTQAYRPVLFSDLSPTATTDVINPNLKDAQGYNSDLGIRGSIRNWINFDLSYFILKYNNRIGRVTVTENNKSYAYITNLNSSLNKGVESFIEINPFKFHSSTQRWGDLSIYNSTAIQDARYTKGMLNGGTKNEINLSGKKVEYAPNLVTRSGLTYAYKFFSLTYQVAHCSGVYTDANNSTPSNGSVSGEIGAYTVHDATLSVRINKQILLKTGLNNLTNTMYVTRRAGGYPGPGLLPGEGRTGFVTFSYIY